MSTVKYTRDHEWIRVDGEIGTVGITNYAQGQLGDIVFVELPEPGRNVKAHEACAIVESVKAASDVFSPIAGEVVEANSQLPANPGLVNEDPEGKAWFFKLKLANQSELDALMDLAAYDAFCKESA